MSAAQPLDMRRFAGARLRQTSRLLWLFIYDRGGEVSDQKREDIAAALLVHKTTVTECAEELETAGWMEGTNRGQGHPKYYRCRQPGQEAAEPTSSSREGRLPEVGKPASSEKAAPQKTAQATSGDVFENAPVDYSKPDNRPVEPAHGLRQGVHPEARASIIDGSRSSLEVVSVNRIVKRDDPNQNRPEKAKLNRQRRLELRSRHAAQTLELIEGKLLERFGIPEGLPALGPDGDQIGPIVLTWAAERRWSEGEVMREFDAIWGRRRDERGELKPGIQRMQSWAHVMRSMQRAMFAKPVQSETRRAPPQKVAVGQQGEAPDPQWSENLMAKVIAGKVGGAGV